MITGYKQSSQPGLSIPQAIIDCCHRLYYKGLVAANEGNISSITGDGDCWFTPSGICKGDLKEIDLVRTDLQGRVLEGHRRITSEFKMHLAIYDIRPDVRAVVHAHPVYSTAFATARIPMEHCVLPEIISTIGIVPLASYGTPSTEELADSVRSVMRSYDVCLMANHGLTAAGRTVHEAYFRIEQVEHYAQILFVTKLLGGGKTLNPHEIERLRNVNNEYNLPLGTVPACRIDVMDSNDAEKECSSCTESDHFSKVSNDTISSIINDIINNLGNSDS